MYIFAVTQYFIIIEPKIDRNDFLINMSFVGSYSITDVLLQSFSDNKHE